MVETVRNLDNGMYRSILRPASDRWLDSARDEVAIWLRNKKGIDLDPENDSRRRSNGISVRTMNHKSGDARAFRLSMDEENEGGRFATTLLAIDDPKDPWLMVRVLNNRRQVIPSPVVARNMLERITMLDGKYEVTRQPTLVHPGMIGELVSRLEDPERRGAVFLLGTGDKIGPAVFSKKMEKWFRDSIGMCQAFILTPDATTELESHLPGFQVPEGTIRTFSPGFSRRDSSPRQQRILGVRALTEYSDYRIRSLLGLFSRMHAESSPIPASVTKWSRTFDRLLNRSLDRDVHNIVPRVTASSNIVQGSGELERVRTTLGIKDLTESTLLRLVEAATRPAPNPEVLNDQARRIEESQEERDGLEDDLQEALKNINDLTEDAYAADERARRAEDELHNLQRKLLLRKINPWAFSVDEEKELPSLCPNEARSWDELSAGRQDWEKYGVFITADDETMCEMEDIDDGRALQAAYEALRALAEYCRASNCGDCSGDFASFLGDNLVGYSGYYPSRVACTESGWTKRNYSRERILPVPQWVDRSGFHEMNSHIRLVKIRNKDPRIYFLDAKNGNGRKCVIVGYIGPHLTNRATSGLN